MGLYLEHNHKVKKINLIINKQCYFLQVYCCLGLLISGRSAVMAAHLSDGACPLSLCHRMQWKVSTEVLVEQVLLVVAGRLWQYQVGSTTV